MGLSGKEKFSYGLGAVGKDMVYMLSASYILYYYQDMSLRTCADVLGISAPTATRRLQQAQKKLRIQLEERG